MYVARTVVLFVSFAIAVLFLKGGGVNLTYSEFKHKVAKVYPDVPVRFSSNGAQHIAKIGDSLVLYMNAGSETIYGMMNGEFIGRALD